MPIYVFNCDKCHKDFEELLARFGDSAPCPHCGSKKVTRVLAPVGIIGSSKSESDSDFGPCGEGPCGMGGEGPCGGGMPCGDDSCDF